MNKNNFIFWEDWSKALRQMPPDIELEARHALEDYVYKSADYTGANIAVKMFMALVKSAIDRQVQSYEKICERNKLNGSKGGRPKKEIDPKETQGNPVGFGETQETQETQDNPINLDNDNDNDNEEKRTTNVVAKKKFDFALSLISNGVSEQTAEDYLKVRRAKKAPETETALNGIIREANKARVTLQEAVMICVERNWQGFKAEWYLKEKSNGTNQNDWGLRHDSSTISSGDYKAEW